jgi:signal transduction histidine kinase
MKLQEDIVKKDVDILKIVKGIISKRKVQAESKNISLSLFDKREKKRSVFGDENLLDLAFSNLIGNSIKYTGNDGKIEIVLYDDKEYTAVEICDNGVGIPEEDKKNIFSEFYRASNVKHKIHDGTGTGLTVVKQIIEQHNGIISFQSPSRLADEKGVGTSFNVKL